MFWLLVCDGSSDYFLSQRSLTFKRSKPIRFWLTAIMALITKFLFIIHHISVSSYIKIRWNLLYLINSHFILNKNVSTRCYQPFVFLCFQMGRKIYFIYSAWKPLFLNISSFCCYYYYSWIYYLLKFSTFINILLILYYFYYTYYFIFTLFFL